MVGSTGCGMLFIVTPDGFENLVWKLSVPAQTRSLPPRVGAGARLGARRRGCESTSVRAARVNLQDDL